MRKITSAIFLAVCLSTIFVSCKKDYTCTCTATVDVPMFGQLSTTETTSLGKTTKKKAEKSCDEAETALQNELGSEGTASCKL